MKQSEMLQQSTINSVQAASLAPPPVVAKSLKDCARLCQQLGQEVAELNIKHLQRFWLSIMSDKSASHKDRLAASKLYAESIGAFDKDKQIKGINGANLRWRSRPIDAEVIEDKKEDLT